MAALATAAESLRAFGAVFGNTNLRRIQLAGIGSMLGGWAYGVAFAVYAYDAGGAELVGFVFFARWAAAAVCAPWLSLLADRMSRRTVMVGSDLVRAGLLLGITVNAAVDGSFAFAFALAVAVSIAGTVFAPAQGALLPALVETPEDLTAANAVMNTVASVGMFAGPALGGVLLAAKGPTAVFVLTTATFLWSALCVLRIPPDTPPAAEPTSVGAALVAGFRAMWATPALRVVVGLTSAQTLVAGAAEVLTVVVALQLLDAGSAGVGWLNAAVGIGGLLGIAAVAVLATRKRLAADLGLGVFLWGAPLAMVALWTNLPIALVLFGVIGLGNTIVDVAGISLLQRTADDQVLGRVFGVLESMALATLALGSLLAPGVVSLLGAKGALVATGLLLPAVLVPLWPVLRRIDAGARDLTEPVELLRGVPMFAPLPPPVLERLAAEAVEVTLPADATVFRQGDVGDRFYVVAAGTAVVSVDGTQPRTISRGGFFGEIALLRDVPRTAAVHAVEPLRLYAIERDEFLAAVTGHAPSREAAETVVTARLSAPPAI
jgi:MFS family permease